MLREPEPAEEVCAHLRHGGDGGGVVGCLQALGLAAGRRPHRLGLTRRLQQLVDLGERVQSQQVIYAGKRQKNMIERDKGLTLVLTPLC